MNYLEMCLLINIMIFLNYVSFLIFNGIAPRLDNVYLKNYWNFFYGKYKSTSQKFHISLKIMCIRLLLYALSCTLEQVFNYVAQILQLLIFFTHKLLNVILKISMYNTCDHLSISPWKYAIFCFVYYYATLLGIYKFRIFLFSWVVPFIIMK